MPSADQVPVISPHSTMQWHKWVVLIAGSTGSALRAVRPPNRHITPETGAISFTPPARRVPCNAHPWPSWPRPFWPSVGERDGGDLGRPACQQCGKPGAAPGAMDLGIADDGESTDGEQTAQVAIALLADTAKLVLATARMLLGHEPDPGREVAPRSESLWISDAGNQGSCQCRTDAWDRIEPPARRVGAVPCHDPAVEL